MTVYEYVARQFNTDGGTGTVVGTNPLDTLDGDSSYVTATWDGTAFTSVTTFRLEPVGAPAPPQSTWTGWRARMAWKRVSGVGGSGRIAHRYLDGASELLLTSPNFGEEFSGIPDEAGADGYVAQWAVEDYLEGPWPDMLAATSWQQFRAVGASGSPATEFRCTYLRVYITAGRAPHQIFQRGDGLGAGSARVFAPGTRQSTGRVFGTH